MIAGRYTYAGTPAMTATSGPGLALMTESLGLAVAAEVPIVVIDVMRGGPSTGIPTKSEQSDLNIALYGLHGDAPHLVLGALSVADCLFTAQWAVHLAEALQVPAIVLSDQFMGQAVSVIERPEPVALHAERRVAARPAADWQRYAVTADGVSEMVLPGAPGGLYTADGLEHDPRGTPSSRADHHLEQLDKRLDKLTGHDYGPAWAEIDGAGEGDIAIVTWGSTAAPVREAVARARAAGLGVRMVAVRLLAPARPAQMTAALAGVRRLLVVEQSHGAQFLDYLRAHYTLPAEVRSLARPGPLPIRPADVLDALTMWS
jgi:2-oxoglutarate ferredoxin oxidoreductase subunit alpha